MFLKPFKFVLDAQEEISHSLFAIRWAWHDGVLSGSESTTSSPGPNTWCVTLKTRAPLKHPCVEDKSTVRWKEPGPPWYRVGQGCFIPHQPRCLVAWICVETVQKKKGEHFSKSLNPPLFLSALSLVIVEIRVPFWFSKARRAVHRWAAPLLPVSLTAAQNHTYVLSHLSASTASIRTLMAENLCVPAVLAVDSKTARQ